MGISDFWKQPNRERYSLLQIAYIALLEEPQDKENARKNASYKLKVIIADILNYLNIEEFKRNNHYNANMHNQYLIYTPEDIFDKYYHKLDYMFSKLEAIKIIDGLKVSNFLKDTPDNQFQPNSKESEAKSNAYTERHAANRAEVLGAALAVLAAWPEQCRSKEGKVQGAKIASLVDEKSGLLWPDTGEAPLKKEKIAEFVNSWIKKTL